jgi:hypothetical protein
VAVWGEEVVFYDDASMGIAEMGVRDRRRESGDVGFVVKW